MAPWRSTEALNKTAQKWWALAERRREHFVELYHTERWKRYYEEEQFVLKMREAAKASDRWAALVAMAAEMCDEKHQGEQQRAA